VRAFLAEKSQVLPDRPRSAAAAIDVDKKPVPFYLCPFYFNEPKLVRLREARVRGDDAHAHAVAAAVASRGGAGVAR
jgi:hypothetical protein